MPMGVIMRLFGKIYAPRAQCRTGQLPRDPQQSCPPTHGEALLMLELLKDFAGFMKERKKYWLAPIVIVVMLLLGLLIVFAHGSAVAPLHLHLVLTLALLHRTRPRGGFFMHPSGYKK
ncbi:MAG: DUF5989 family protein [Pseudomonadales bacterium]